MNWPKTGRRLDSGSDIQCPPQAEAGVRFGHEIKRGYLGNPEEGAKRVLVRVSRWTWPPVTGPRVGEL
jgi:hypothetical protein